MTPLGALILAILIPLVSFGSRRTALIAMLAGVMFITQGQSVVIVGFTVFPMRLIEVAAFIRVMRRNEFSFHRTTRLDKGLIALSIFIPVVFTLRGGEGAAYQFGAAADAFLCYFSFRGLMQDFEDYRWFLKGFLILLVPFSAIVWVEHLTQFNLFSILGGLPTEMYRNGRLRCIGSFRHPSIMGSLGATFIVMYLSLAVFKEYRKIVLIALACCGATIIAANSGGPVNAAGIGIVAWMCWMFRNRLRMVRWGLVAMFVGLAIVMKAPIYYLPAKVSGLTGGGGYHRSFLIEQALKDLPKWAVAGMDITETVDWFPYHLQETGGADMTNYFIAYGVRAGLGAVFILLFILVAAYGLLGRGLATLREQGPDFRMQELMLWGLGAMLTAHAANWFTITYWDQFCVIFYFQLATISSLSQAAIENTYEPIEEVELVPEEGGSAWRPL